MERRNWCFDTRYPALAFGVIFTSRQGEYDSEIAME